MDNDECLVKCMATVGQQDNKFFGQRWKISCGMNELIL